MEDTQPSLFLCPTVLQIPPISDALLADLSARIKPVVMNDDNELFYIEPVDPRTIAFTWDPKLVGGPLDLVPVVRLWTLHSYAAPSLFKASVAEVLAQIPAGYLDSIVAFTTECPEDSVSSWPEYYRTAFDGGYHLATTTLYAEAE